MPKIPPPKDVKRTDEPHNRETRMCDRLATAFDADPEKREDDRLIIFISNDERSGIVEHGWRDDNEAIVALLLHLQAMFAAAGKTLAFAPVQDPRGN